MKTTIATLMTAGLLALSGCGGDDLPSAADGSGSGATEQGVSVPEGEGSYLLQTSAKQIASSLGRGAKYSIDGTTMTFTFTDGSADENGTSACQISKTVLDAVAPGEVETLVMKYPGGTLDCAELLG